MERTLQPRWGVGVVNRYDGAINPNIGKQVRCANGIGRIRSKVVDATPPEPVWWPELSAVDFANAAVMARAVGA